MENNIQATASNTNELLAKLNSVRNQSNLVHEIARLEDLLRIIRQ